MTATRLNGFEHAIHTANIWLNDVLAGLGTEDRQLANRAMRAWLHTFRDRLTTDAAAHFAAQLPELLRGVYYDGWDPSIVPVKYDRESYVNRFAHEAKIDAGEVPGTAAAVTGALHAHLSPGQMESALAQFPQDLRHLLGAEAFQPAR